MSFAPFLCCALSHIPRVLSNVPFFPFGLSKEKQNPASEFSLKNIVLTALNVFFAGTETVSTTLRYGFLLLLKHPEIEGKRKGGTKETQRAGSSAGVNQPGSAEGSGGSSIYTSSGWGRTVTARQRV